MRNHLKPRSVLCAICGVLAPCTNSRKSQRCHVHGLGEHLYLSAECGKESVRNTSLGSHAKETAYLCQACGQLFSTWRAFKNHAVKQCQLETQTTVRCQICNREYLTNQSLEAHLKNCAGNICKTCGQRFSHRESLSRHLRVHSDSKPFKCKFCSKSFKSTAYLKAHVRTHTGERPFRCRYCWKRFTQGTSRHTHEKFHIRNGDSLSVS